jgi:hypothetical protein
MWTHAEHVYFLVRGHDRNDPDISRNQVADRSAICNLASVREDVSRTAQIST